jgi:hypothetical protein
LVLFEYGAKEIKALEIAKKIWWSIIQRYNTIAMIYKSNNENQK